MPEVVLRIIRKMVDFDVSSHPQQLVQVGGWLTGIHVNLIIRKAWRIEWFLIRGYFINKKTR